MNSSVSELKKKTFSGFLWVFLERIGAQLVTFIVSIILARILLPEDYGVISLVLVFINICNVFVQAGFGNALIQKSDADDLDFSSVFYFSVVFSTVLYIGIYCISPFISNFYNMEILTPVIRVMGLRLIIAAVNSVQKVRISKNMEFKKFFFATIIGTIISAFVGIGFAYMGFGVWALVAQYLTNSIIDTLVLQITVRWYPKLSFSFNRMKSLFSYGWKFLVASLIDVVYEDFRSLYIGKLYTANDLAYYTRGKQFPNMIVNNVVSSISSVLFPAISKEQNDKNIVKAITRRSIKTSSYIMMPLMFGLAAVAKPMVILLLTEKWLPCVPFVQILCFNSALMPIQNANVQAIYGVGRSDIALKLNIIKKTVGFLVILLTARISVLAMAVGGIFTAIFASVVNAYPNKKLLGYGYFEQIKDILPYISISFVMSVVVLLIGMLNLSEIITLIIQVVVGGLLYIWMSKVFRIESFTYILDTIKSLIKK